MLLREAMNLVKSATFHLFKLNPEEFIIKAGLIINDCKALAVIQCIKYEKLNDKFSTDIFTENMLRGTLRPSCARQHGYREELCRILGVRR